MLLPSMHFKIIETPNSKELEKFIRKIPHNSVISVTQEEYNFLIKEKYIQNTSDQKHYKDFDGTKGVAKKPFKDVLEKIYILRRDNKINRLLHDNKQK